MAFGGVLFVVVDCEVLVKVICTLEDVKNF